MTSIEISRGRRCAYLALTALWFTIAFAGLAEVFLQLRWTPPSSQSYGAFGPHPLYMTGPLPGAQGHQVSTEYDRTFSISLIGTRGEMPELSQPSTKPRLLVVGDSQTFGLGCNNDETFCHGLQGLLPGISVLNTGSNGYGTREQLAVIHHLGEAWKPDVVLVVFFWNDLEDNIKHPRPTFGLDDAGRVKRTDDYDHEFDPLALREAVQLQPAGRPAILLPRFLKEGLRGLRYRTLGIKKRKIRTPEQMDAAWVVMDELLALMKQRTDELGAKLVIAALPDQNQADPTAIIRHIDPLNFDVQERLFARCDELGIESIDLLPALKQQFDLDGLPLYYYADRHLMPRGASLVARTLFGALSATFASPAVPK